MRTKKEALSALAQRGYSPSLVVDIGVASGTEGLYLVWSDAHYILVEGLPKFRDDLRRIASELKSCETLMAFAGRSANTVEIATDPNHIHNHRLASAAPSEWPRDHVSVVTVDSFVTQKVAIGAGTQIVLKIDVDGGELDVLEGARATLTCDCVIVIEAALLDERTSRFGRIVNFLTAHGYEIFDIIEPMFRPADGLLWQVDLIFVPRDSTIRSGRLYL